MNKLLITWYCFIIVSNIYTHKALFSRCRTWFTSSKNGLNRVRLCALCCKLCFGCLTSPMTKKLSTWKVSRGRSFQKLCASDRVRYGKVASYLFHILHKFVWNSFAARKVVDLDEFSQNYELHNPICKSHLVQIHSSKSTRQRLQCGMPTWPWNLPGVGDELPF